MKKRNSTNPKYPSILDCVLWPVLAVIAATLAADIYLQSTIWSKDNMALGHSDQRKWDREEAEMIRRHNERRAAEEAAQAEAEAKQSESEENQ